MQSQPSPAADTPVQPCSAPGCKSSAAWTADSSAAVHCEPHDRAWLMSDDREDFADEYTAEARREASR